MHVKRILHKMGLEDKLKICMNARISLEIKDLEKE